MSELLPIWNEQQLTGATIPPLFIIANTTNARSVKINNQSHFWLVLSNAQTGIDMDIIEPYSYLIFPYTPDIAVKIYTDSTGKPYTSSLEPDIQFVNYSTISGVASYEKGSTQFSGSNTVNIGSGNVNIASGNVLDVAIQGTPEFTLAPGTAVQIAGTTDVNIANTPEVLLASGTAVNIAGTPTFQIAPGTSIGIDVNANTVTLQEGAGVTVQNQSIGTDIGFGMTRDPGGGVFFAQNTGITAVPFNEIVQQVYIQNRGSADIYVTGDEDPTMQSQGLLLSSGDAIGLSWRTKNLYIKSAAAQIPVQCQGFY